METVDAPRILTADEIFAAKDIEERVVDVPQWGGAVRIRTFTKKQAETIEKAATRFNQRTRQDEVDKDKFVALLFVEGVIEPKFTFQQWDQLREKSAVAIGLIQQAILMASGLSEAAVTDADKSTGPESSAEI